MRQLCFLWHGRQSRGRGFGLTSGSVRTTGARPSSIFSVSVANRAQTRTTRLLDVHGRWTVIERLAQATKYELVAKWLYRRGGNSRTVASSDTKTFAALGGLQGPRHRNFCSLHPYLPRLGEASFGGALLQDLCGARVGCLALGALGVQGAETRSAKHCRTGHKNEVLPRMDERRAVRDRSSIGSQVAGCVIVCTSLPGQ